MRILKMTGLSIAAVATLAVGIAPAMARPHDNRPHHDRRGHKVCHMERHHGHAQRVCRWVR